MENNNKFTVLNKEGKKVECEVLFTFESEETNKNYIVYNHRFRRLSQYSDGVIPICFLNIRLKCWG